MYTGEAEIQARRRVLTALQDQVRKVLEGARDLSLLYDNVLNKKELEMRENVSRIRAVEDDVESVRRSLARQLAEIGPLMVNREDVLRAAYHIEALTAFLVGMAFRISHLRKSTVERAGIAQPLRNLLDLSLEMIHRLNEVVRALAMNPQSTWELASSVQNLEREIDDKYRNLTIEILKRVKSVPDLLLLKDIIERVEGMADVCLEATDSVTVLALGL